MIDIPININWNNHGFQYAISVSENTIIDSRTYRYIVYDKVPPEIPEGHQHGEDHRHNINYVQFVNSPLDDNFINLKKDVNVYYEIPFEYGTYRFVSYGPGDDWTAKYGEGYVRADGIVNGCALVTIIDNPADESWVGRRVLVKTDKITQSKQNIYDYEIDDEGNIISITLIDNIKVRIIENNYKDQFLPDYIDPEKPDPVPPVNIKVRKVRLNIPWFKIDNYRKCNYAVKFTTWISGIEVVIGCYLVTPDMYRAMSYRVYKEDRYAEYVDLYIIDPWSLIYDDDWKDWRISICGESDNLNNTGSSMRVSIIPIEPIEDHYGIISNSSIGAYNMTISDDLSDYMHLDIGFVPYKSDILAEIKYNRTYSNILEYLLETYGVNIPEENLKIEYILSIISPDDDDMGFLVPEETYVQDETEDPIRAIESHVFLKTNLGIKDWSEYVPGMYMTVTAVILNGDDVVTSIISDLVPLTPDTYKYLIITDLDSPEFEDTPVKLNTAEMLNYVIHAVNKINKNVVQVENAREYKSNIIHPVFFQANKLNDVTIHPLVTENICLNLNGYKSKVDFFYLKVEGVVFPEIGRNHNGVIFKVQGHLLPNSVESGILYVLNKDKELVTTGNFQYIQ